jgi:hypothetical protein
MYKEYIEIEGGIQVRIMYIPSSTIEVITEPPNVGSKATPTTPQHWVVGAASELTYAEQKGS